MLLFAGGTALQAQNMLLAFMNLSLTNVLMHLMNFIFLTIVLYLLLFKPISKKIKQRQEKEDKIKRENEQLNAEVKKMKADFENIMEVA